MDVIALLVGVAVTIGLVIAVLRLRTSKGPEHRSPAQARGGSSRVDKFAVGEPWRQHIAAALSAQRRFNRIVGTLDDGPLRARMADIGRQVDRGVDECWQIAQRGDQLDDTIRQLDGAVLQSRLDRATDETQRASLRSQLDSVDRVRRARQQTDDRLRDLHTRLGELVSSAAEVTSGVDHTAELGSAVDEVVNQLKALSQAVDEVNNTGRSTGFEQPGPGTPSPT